MWRKDTKTCLQLRDQIKQNYWANINRKKKKLLQFHNNLSHKKLMLTTTSNLPRLTERSAKEKLRKMKYRLLHKELL
jgi:hypothetical protein